MPTLKAVHDAGVPVMGHIGLTPQNAAQLGGLRCQGGDAVAGRRLLEDALALEAGRGVRRDPRVRPARGRQDHHRTPSRANRSAMGRACIAMARGMVSADMLGLFEQVHAALRQALWSILQRRYSRRILRSYCSEVVAGQFPDDKHS